MQQNRRDFLAFSFKAAILSLGLNVGLPLRSVFALDDFAAKLPVPAHSGLFGLLPYQDKLTLKAVNIPKLLPANNSPMLAYQTTTPSGTFYNPILVLQKGQRFEADLENGLQEPTIIHWHGVDAPWKQAGHPSYAINPGGRYEYAFEITNRAGTYWYHPHPHMLTARQAYLGLSSFFIVRDDEENALAKEMDLQLGETDIPIVIQDKKFNAAGALDYSPTKEELMMGYLGDRVLVNGAEKPTLDVSTRAYRFRMLNGSTSRIYNLAFLADKRKLPFQLIGNDGGLLPSPQQIDEVFLAPGERLDVILDLTSLAPGAVIFLQSLPYDPMHNEMAGMSGMGNMNGMGGMGNMGSMDNMKGMGGMMHGSGMAMGTKSGGHGNGGLEEGTSFPILRLFIKEKVAYSRTLPRTLSAIAPLPDAPGTERPISLAMQHMGGWTINGLTFSMNDAPIVVSERKRETWIIGNASASMPHPMHLHGYFYRVRSRQNSPEQVRKQAIDSSGRLPSDLGFKDTVLVWPGESVAVDIDFSTPNYPGSQLFLFHCHNLEHEDQGMMLNIRVA